MKPVLKKKISGFHDLTKPERKQIQEEAEASFPKALSFSVGAVGVVVIGGSAGLIDRILNGNSAYDNLWWLKPVVGISVTIVFISIYNLMLINPRIKKILENKPNQSSEPT